MTVTAVRIGTAGWSLPREVRDRFGAGASLLERYATRFSCVEIDSSFYRPHRRSTYERWSSAVPDAFRFAVKLPKAITHVLRLVDCTEPLSVFLTEAGGLGEKLDVLLVQLPPSLAFDAPSVAAFLLMLRERYAGDVVVEPRHASWFDGEADALLGAEGAARVAADPAVVAAAAEPGGSGGLAYYRLHGAPVTYMSPYPEARLDALARSVRSRREPAWVIFDNTARGAATADALVLLAKLAAFPNC